MRVFTQAVAIVITLLFGNTFIHAQITNDPSGHWEGTITMPMGELRFEIDLTRDGTGQLSGTIGVPEQKLKGLPLTSVAMDGSAVTFAIRGGQGGTFRAKLSTDGHTMKGTAASQEGEAPFDLTRTGEARIAAAPKNAPIGKELEGTWHGTLDVRGGMRVILRLANQPDGTSTASMVSVDEGNLEIAMALVREGSTVRLNSPVLGSSYSGELNATATELNGNYTTSQGITLPLTLHRND
jgi:hypothetical protein